MCNHPNREAAMERVRSLNRAPGVPEYDAWCDPCLVPLVRALNDAGIRTVASCCGHGHRPGNIALADGRALVIVGTFDDALTIDRAFPCDINGDLTQHAKEQESAATLCDPLSPEQNRERARALDRLAQQRIPKDQIG